ncbi:hypothetical protein ABBQ32_009901 [Trebouxia sp. C0010 RCD-2024]
MKREDADVQRLEKILSKHGRKQSSEEAQPRRSRSEDSVGEQPLKDLASESGVPMNTGREAAPAQRQTGVVVEDLECSVLENALKEQVYRLTGQWQQGAQRLSNHLEEALLELAEVRQHENDVLKRRMELCHQELDDQVAQLEHSFHLKAIQAKAESLLGVLEQVDAVPSPSTPDVRMHAADHG